MRWSVPSVVAALGALGAFWGSGPATARADEFGDAAIDKIKRLSIDLRFDEAQRTCTDAFALHDLSLADNAELHYACAVVAATLDEADRAEELFRIALVLDATRRPPDDATPRVQAAFERARAWWAAHTPFGLAHEPPTAPPAGAPLVLQVVVRSDPLKLVAGVRVYCRRRGETDFHPAGAAKRKADELVVSVDAAEGGGGVEYYLAATSASGSVVALVGGPEAPLRARVETPRPPPPGGGGGVTPPAARPLLARPLFWGVVLGVVVAGMTAAVAAALLRPDSADVVFRFEVR
ncbi:MAG TPA: hypothetical protein VG389_17155 [Myxococcota bacterium]|jgi:hypothetical protein|nr:hypothetical protein [Myxococcota bacterium]